MSAQGRERCDDRDVDGSLAVDRRLRIANLAYDLIESEVRPFLATGGRLWTKGSGGYPSRIRQLLRGVEHARSVYECLGHGLELIGCARVTRRGDYTVP